MTPADYSTTEDLRDGRKVMIRALRPTDREGVLAVVDGMSDEALYRRFFATKRVFTEKEVEYFLNVDFVDHVMLVAEVDDPTGSVIAGGGRYIVIAPGRAEIAFAMADRYHGLGIGTRLVRHLASIARAAGLRAFEAEVLPENTAMLKVFERCGLPLTVRRDAGVVHVSLDLAGTAADTGSIGVN